MDDVAALISALNNRFGEEVRITTFFEGGVFPGVVGREGCGVDCLDGVVGFFTGVEECLDRGVVEILASLLRRRLFPLKAAILGLPVSDAMVCVEAEGFEGEEIFAWNGELVMSVSNSIIFFALVRFSLLGG